MLKTREKVIDCSGAADDGGECRKNYIRRPLPYAPTATAVEAVVGQEVQVQVDEVKMEAEDHLAREYVQEFVLDHLDPADVKREVILFDPFYRTQHK